MDEEEVGGGDEESEKKEEVLEGWEKEGRFLSYASVSPA